MDPKLTVTFNIRNLVSKRSVVFARAGYGKSNLIKFLIAELYRSQPTTESGLPVGTLIFDPDGEYFWPDSVRKRPGLCDVEHLQDKLVVFTNRPAPSPYYGSWKAGEVKLDIRDLPPGDVISLAVSSERQTQQNVLKLKSIPQASWRELVDLIYAQRLQVPDGEIGRLLGYSEDQIDRNLAEIGAARSNLYNVVRTLHDPTSRVLGGTLEALSKGSIVVLDISLLSSAAGNMLAGLLLRRIFSHNQENFTGGQSIIPTVAVIEEAQSVLGKNLDDTSPYVEWVKEGRKYDLGAVLITQQPGSMAAELLSQADNWFCFHLLSEGDAGTLGKYNSHFSDDVLSHLIAEPIAGNCFMWSAPHQPFVLPVRIRSFEELYGKNVKPDSAAGRREGTRAQEITQSVSESTDRLKSGLIAKLNEQTTKFVRIPGAMLDGSDGIGIKSGQLFYKIREIKTPSDTQSEDQLKRHLLTLMLGEGALRIIRHQNTEYYCATLSAWTEALGRTPNVKELE